MGEIREVTERSFLAFKCVEDYGYGLWDPSARNKPALSQSKSRQVGFGWA
jgi:hypothetical protein